MSHPTLIGITGLAGSGKDTVRQILENEHGYTGLAFAEPLRGMLRELFNSNGIDEAFIDARNLKELTIPNLGVSYRHMAQTLGTEWGRSLQPDFWLRIAHTFMHNRKRQGDTHFVISDVRFANEAAWVRERGGVIWRIERPGLDPVRNHQSETEMRAITADLTLLNDGDLDNLWRLVDDAINCMEVYR